MRHLERDSLQTRVCRRVERESAVEKLSVPRMTCTDDFADNEVKMMNLMTINNSLHLASKVASISCQKV
jgi:hypothetical protein